MTDAAGHQAPQAAPYPHAYGSAPTAEPSKALSITSLVLGFASIVFSWTFFAPIAGLVVGILALRSEPASRTMAIWGIVLNAVMLAGAVIVALIAVIGAGIGFAFLPFAVQ
ncbi:DUF4190 domain-containing protein [Leifsonia sp. NPDC058248]|uniref:DUF4190 domain-containing protein n=1 Tax=Leifsonia sp. NPDC058248 TaxID=3346402 RepID=UPI0036DEDFF2